MTELQIADLALVHYPVTDNTTWSFIGMRAEDGVTGWGEATWNRQPHSLDAPFETARLALRGQNRQRLEELIASTPSSQAAAAVRSALEQASWDIRGKRVRRHAAFLQGTPVRRAIPLYANINRGIRERTEQGFQHAARQAELAGFDHIKIAPFDGVGRDTAGTRQGRTLIDAGLRRVAATRQALSQATELYVDCHWRFDAHTAAWVMEELASHGVTWFECPLPETIDNFPSLKKLRSLAHRYNMRLAGLEELTDARAFEPWLQAGIYDVVMPDVKYAGGISSLLEIAGQAKKFGVTCSPHNPSGPVSYAASLTACALAENMARLEHQYNETPLFWQLMREDFPKPAGGASLLPTQPGLGMHIPWPVANRLADKQSLPSNR
ncbi:enolase C-terminal domain-like protein [Brenneria tiliae]|uniref:Mandelate racemase/muconate lactonizing enzyme C-terminal domain-containing protein n=1 Tax=Brenneria tiliae TaxID=2914984 RepID=A0ABT0MV24_9GAMM|nr:enolase C-terminal domain-like protein [Brenneria tiliae]MCL2893716.1 hypothetical protein [Brenneria tiliae]